jgi:hypothetical protein
VETDARILMALLSVVCATVEAAQGRQSDNDMKWLAIDLGVALALVTRLGA